MGVLMIVLAALGGIAGTVFVGLLKDEAAAWMPALRHKIVRIALSYVPIGDRSRYEEEWLSHIDEYPGNMSKLVQSLCILKGGLLLRRQKTTVTYEDMLRLSNMSIPVGGIYALTEFAYTAGSWADYPIFIINHGCGLFCAWCTYRQIKHWRVTYDGLRKDLSSLRSRY